MLAALGHVARHRRFVLVLGLAAGLVMPGTALALRPWLSELVFLLLFVTAFRVGHPAALAGLKHMRSSPRICLTYQLALPMACIALFTAMGMGQSPVAIALTLRLAAQSVTGSPNLAVMLGHEPELPFRLLILGTMILPRTIVPIFWLSPALGGLPDGLRLCLSISATISFAFALRALLRPKMKPEEAAALDGINTIALAVIVIGLMCAFGPALSADPWALAGWMYVAFAANIGLQLLAYLTLLQYGEARTAAPLALVAGNRNGALFLVAASATRTEEFLIFLACYPFPMSLTPIIMRPLFGSRSDTS